MSLFSERPTLPAATVQPNNFFPPFSRKANEQSGMAWEGEVRIIVPLGEFLSTSCKKNKESITY
jgi:hypothetical protein